MTDPATAADEQSAPLNERQVQFAESLATLIRVRGYTGRQKVLAEELGVSEAALTHYLKGRSTPSFKQLVAIAEHFKVSLDYLAFGDVQNPVAAPEQDALSRQVQSALREAGRQSAMRFDLTSRLSQKMVESLEEAVDEVMRQPMPLQDAAARTMSIEDQIALEEVAIKVKIHSGLANLDPATGRRSGTTTETQDGKIIPGPFLGVQAANLKRGIPYQNVIAGPPDDWARRASRLRNNLMNAGVSSAVLSRHQARGSSEPVIASVVMLYLPAPDAPRLKSPVKMLLERYAGYIRPSDNLLAYISLIDDLYQGGFPLSNMHRDNAELLFENAWNEKHIL